MRPEWHLVCVAPKLRHRERGGQQLGVQRALPETPRELHQRTAVCASKGAGAGEGRRDQDRERRPFSSSILPSYRLRPRVGRTPGCPQRLQGRLRWEPGCREVLGKLGFLSRDPPALPLCGPGLPYCSGSLPVTISQAGEGRPRANVERPVCSWPLQASILCTPHPPSPRN